MFDQHRLPCPVYLPTSGSYRGCSVAVLGQRAVHSFVECAYWQLGPPAHALLFLAVSVGAFLVRRALSLCDLLSGTDADRSPIWAHTCAAVRSLIGLPLFLLGALLVIYCCFLHSVRNGEQHRVALLRDVCCMPARHAHHCLHWSWTLVACRRWPSLSPMAS